MAARDPSLRQHIGRARQLLVTVRHAAMATVNADGTPHNTPYFFMISRDLRQLYWASHPRSVHSQNVMRTGRVFVVLYDAMERGGLYIEGTEGHVLEGDELGAGLEAHNERRAAEGKEPLVPAYYAGDAPQRMWGARTLRFWVNGAVRDGEGLVIEDIRTEVKRQDLL